MLKVQGLIEKRCVPCDSDEALWSWCNKNEDHISYSGIFHELIEDGGGGGREALRWAQGPVWWGSQWQS